MSETNRRARLVVCDDEAAARRGMMRALARGDAYAFVECADGRACLDAVAASPCDLVLLDLRMPGLDGRATLARLIEMPAPPPVVVVTADANLRTAIDAVKAGAADFLAKPYEIEALRWTVERNLATGRLARENRDLRDDLQRLGASGDLLGASPVMRELFTALEQVGPAEASVLIRGETGTGKELVARRLHQLSPRGQGPFVAVNCAAVPEGLLESELFGHRKGAFTGADRDRPGRFQRAHSGTLFLDEVGDMPAAAQAKLLRVLQDGVVEPLGGGTERRVDVRVLAATHRDLEAACADGTFRDDLYYRLRVVELTSPPLRARGDDVVLLAQSFLNGCGRGRLEIAPEAAEALRAHAWPGNVRELRNAMERAAIFCRNGVVRRRDLPAELAGLGAVGLGAVGLGAVGARAVDRAWPAGTSFQDAKQQVVTRFEYTFFRALLERHQGNVSRAARDAALHRQNLQKKLRQLDLDPADFRPT